MYVFMFVGLVGVSSRNMPFIHAVVRACAGDKDVVCVCVCFCMFGCVGVSQHYDSF
jgi:hypothetical protein